MEEEARVQLHAIVRGYVQGVGFRAFAKHHAVHLEITGMIRNLADGGVEFYAQGTHAQLKKFLTALSSGVIGNISSLSTEYTPITQIYEKFTISL